MALLEVAEERKTIASERSSTCGSIRRTEVRYNYISEREKNLETTVERGEERPTMKKKLLVKKVKVEVIDPAHDLSDESSRDQARHAQDVERFT